MFLALFGVIFAWKRFPNFYLKKQEVKIPDPFVLIFTAKSAKNTENRRVPLAPFKFFLMADIKNRFRYVFRPINEHLKNVLRKKVCAHKRHRKKFGKVHQKKFWPWSTNVFFCAFCVHILFPTIFSETFIYIPFKYTEAIFDMWLQKKDQGGYRNSRIWFQLFFWFHMSNCFSEDHSVPELLWEKVLSHYRQYFIPPPPKKA